MRGPISVRVTHIHTLTHTFDIDTIISGRLWTGPTNIVLGFYPYFPKRYSTLLLLFPSKWIISCNYFQYISMVSTPEPRQPQQHHYPKNVFYTNPIIYQHPFTPLAVDNIKIYHISTRKNVVEIKRKWCDFHAGRPKKKCLCLECVNN